MLATDADTGLNAEIYYFINGTNANYFSIHPVTGVITVTSSGTRSLDRELWPEVTLEVMAADRRGGYGSFNSTTLLNITILDLNDNKPVFGETSYAFTVSEDVGVNSVIGQVSASDTDASPNNRIVYDIVSGAEGLFRMDRNSGMYQYEQ